MKQRALVLCASDPNTDPRPNRMIHWLRDDFDVTVVGWKEMIIPGVESVSLLPTDSSEANSGASKPRRRLATLIHAFAYLHRLVTARYEEIVWSKLGRASELVEDLQDRNFNLVVSHDCLMLPLAFCIKQARTKVVLDAREYYPKNYNDQWRWRLLTKPVNQYLCGKYLSKCDMILTVSQGLADEYAKEYDVSPEVVLSLPRYRNLEPSPVEVDRVRMIYHGLAGASRKTEVMLELMDFMDARFQLDLMLMPSQDVYFQKIVAMAEARRNVRVISPVAMDEIPTFINQYDIGLFLCPPTNFNLSFALPNKLFEFIQGRLVVAIGPNVEMKKVVERYQCGVVSPDFDPQSLAKLLSQLTAESIMHYKRQSHMAAEELSSETSRKQVERLFQRLF